MHPTWQNIQNRLNYLIEQGKIHEFWDHPDIRNTMLFVDEKAGRQEYDCLIDSNDSQRYERVLEDPEITPSSLKRVFGKNISTLNLDKLVSINTIHHVLHIYTFEYYAGIKIDSLSKIYELGGGFGNTARIIYNLGFSGEYYITDLPALCKIQKYYLEKSQCSINAKWVDFIPFNIDMFIAEWSLTEIPTNEQTRYLNIKCPYFLIAGGLTFEEQSNAEFLKKFVELRKHTHNIHLIKIDHLKNANSMYIIGSPK